MSNVFEYCTKCDKKLATEEKEKNEMYDNLIYPRCQECLNRFVKEAKEVFQQEKTSP